MKKIVSALIAAVLAMALFTACGGSSSAPAAKTAAEVYDAVLAANTISNPRQLTDTDIQFEYLLAMEDVAEFAGVASNDAYNAGVVLVVKAAEGKADTVKAALEEYRQGWLTASAGYTEDYATAIPNVENGVLTASGDLVVMAWASNECADAAGLSAAVDAALK